MKLIINMNRNRNAKNPKIPMRFTKRTLIVLFCLALSSFFITSCYTTQKCPAYGYISPNDKNVRA